MLHVSLCLVLSVLLSASCAVAAIEYPITLTVEENMALSYLTEQ